MKLSSPFFYDGLKTSRVMLMVLIGLLPGALIQFYYFGYGVIINLVMCSLFALVSEHAILRLRNRNPWNTIKDNSALVTGILIGLAIPPTLPIWMSFIGVTFAIIFAKQIYGGLGFNPFNPAMVGYVLLLISFPVEMTNWQPSLVQSELPSLVDSFTIIFFGQTSSGITANDLRLTVDGYTMATPLDHLKTEHTLGKMNSEIVNSTQFKQSVEGWFWVNIGFLIGGVFLLATKVIRWQIPTSFLAGIFITSLALNFWDNQLFMNPSFHLTIGATMLGAFFIATDPVSASTTPKGRLIYGFMIGFFVIIIRTFGGYPEAVAFSVILLNLAVPTIDHYTKPAIYGHQLKEQSSSGASDDG